jgi:hypothetical protein
MSGITEDEGKVFMRHGVQGKVNNDRKRDIRL